MWSFTLDAGHQLVYFSGLRSQDAVLHWMLRNGNGLAVIVVERGIVRNAQGLFVFVWSSLLLRLLKNLLVLESLRARLRVKHAHVELVVSVPGFSFRNQRQRLS